VTDRRWDVGYQFDSTSRLSSMLYPVRLTLHVAANTIV
jgi:hypothetical protein